MNYENILKEDVPSYAEDIGGARRALDRLTHEQEWLAKAVVVHAEKVEPALSPTQPEPGAVDGVKRADNGSWLTTRLNALADDFADRRAALESLTQRVDL